MKEQVSAKDALFMGPLTPVDAANAIRSARLTALDLADTAELLFMLKRFHHSTALSILAVEEASKLALLFMIFLELDDGARRKLWKSFRNHRAKTAWLNPAFESRIRGAFPKISREEAKKISQVGPSPDDLEITKQRAFYSECYGRSDCFMSHCPSIAEWRDLAWDRMWEAKALATGMRDHTPQELEVWREHFTAASKAGDGIAAVMPRLHDVLLEKKLIQEGWWKTLLEDLAFETEPSG